MTRAPVRAEDQAYPNSDTSWTLDRAPTYPSIEFKLADSSRHMSPPHLIQSASHHVRRSNVRPTKAFARHVLASSLHVRALRRGHRISSPAVGGGTREARAGTSGVGRAIIRTMRVCIFNFWVLVVAIYCIVRTWKPRTHECYTYFNLWMSIIAD